MTTLEQIQDMAAEFEKTLKHGYYLENANREDYGLEFCPQCVKKVIRDEKAKGKRWEKYQLDPSSDHDTRVRCEECGAWLHGYFTDYGAEEELDHFEACGFDPSSPDDCWSFHLCETAFLEDSDEYRRLLAVARLPVGQQAERKDGGS